MLFTSGFVTQDCSRFPTVADGMDALRQHHNNCVMSGQNSVAMSDGFTFPEQKANLGPFSMSFETAQTVSGYLTIFVWLFAATLMFLLFTGRLPISGIFRSVAAGRVLDKAQREHNKAKVAPVEEPVAPAAPVSVTPVSESDAEVSADEPKEVDYSQVPFGRRPTWLHPNTPDPLEFFKGYGDQESSDEDE